MKRTKLTKKHLILTKKHKQFIAKKKKASWAWSELYFHMSAKILPLFLEFKENKKSGWPTYLGVYFKEELLANGFVYNENTHDWGQDKWFEQKWQWVIDEIIYALQVCVDDDNDQDCRMPNPDYNPNQKECMNWNTPRNGDGTCSVIFNKDYGKTKLDFVAWEKKQQRVRKALEMLGAFWQCFWD